MLDRGGQLKISGFGLIKLSKVSEDNVKVVNHEAHIDKSSKKQCFIFFISLLETLFLKVLVLIITFWTADCYIAPELYKNIIFDKSVDVHSFGVILYEVVTHKTFILLIVIKDIWTLVLYMWRWLREYRFFILNPLKRLQSRYVWKEGDQQSRQSPRVTLQNWKSNHLKILLMFKSIF